MSRSLLRALRAAWSRRDEVRSNVTRKGFRLRLESLESRLLLHAAGTLGDEHEAVMELIDFQEIHATTADPTFYVARDGNGALPNYWSDVRNWSVATFTTDPAQVNDPHFPGFYLSDAAHLPSTGDDVEIPHNLDFIYDLGLDAFSDPATLPTPLPAPNPSNPSPSIPSLKNNLRLRSIGVEGSLTFEPNPASTSAELLMIFETLVVASSGALTIDENEAARSVRLVIAAPDWHDFSLAEPFDTELDPLQFGRGFISHGAVSLSGESVTPFVTRPQLTKKDNNVTVDANNKILTPTVTTVPAKNGTTRQVVTQPPPANAFQFTIPGAAPAGWTKGDRIVVTGTEAGRVNSATGASGDEEAVIADIVTTTAVGPVGPVTTTRIIAKVELSTATPANPLSPPNKVGILQFDHITPLDASGKPLGIQIANLTRNINIQSEDPFHTMARGHVMFMHSAEVNVAGVGFLGLGRSDKRTVVDDPQQYTKEIIDALNQAGSLSDPDYKLLGHFIPGTGLNPRGRYPVHFHRAGISETDGTDPAHPLLRSTTPAEIEDSVVVDGPGWGFVNHSGFVNFDDNVAFNVIGASFVTEAGNELGRFVGNLAIKGIGANTGEGIESRKVKQDFGFQGDGFWFQGASIQVDNNIAVSQRHDGFVFFTQPLVQNYKWAPDLSHPHVIVSARQAANTTTDLLAAYATQSAGPSYDPAVIAAFGGPGKTVDPGNVPILSFKNNTALAVGTGFETWFHQLGSPLNTTTQRALGSQVVGLRVANTRGTGMFDPYTNLLTVQDTQLIGNPNSPSGTGMGRNDVTANLTYDNVSVRGFGLGVALPVNGLDIVTGGTYQNKRNFEITTANSQSRTIWLKDKRDAAGAMISPLTFVALPKPADEAARINVDLRTSYNPKERDLSKLFNPDIIRMGTVWLDSFNLGAWSDPSKPGSTPKQLYYFQQAATFKPFPANDESGNPINYGGPLYDAFQNIVDYSGIEVPSALFDKNNEVLMASYGLAIGGAVAPHDAVSGLGSYPLFGGDPAVHVSPRINGLIGPAADYQTSLDAKSARYTKAVDPSPDGVSSPQYTFSYRFSRPAADPTGAPDTVNVTVKVGNFGPNPNFPSAPYNAATFPIRLGTTTVNGVQVPILSVNGLPVVIPPPVSPPPKPVEPAKLPTTVGPNLTAKQAQAYAAANKAAATKFTNDTKAYNTWWTKYYDTPVKLSLKPSWNVVTGDLEGTPKLRTQLIYGDVLPPDLNLTAPDQFQLRRLTTAANPWTPGAWDATPQQMTGIALGSTDNKVGVTTVTGQFVAVMNPSDLSFGFSLKGKVIDNSFGHKSFEVFIGNLSNYLDKTDPSKSMPFLTPPTDPNTGAALPNYESILNYESFKAIQQTPAGTTAPAGVPAVQRLQTLFFSVKDAAGNTKTFALTIYLDPTAPRVGGNSNPSGSVTPSTSMVSLANQAYIIDLDTFNMISLTSPKKKSP